jgi:hypothetical protein
MLKALVFSTVKARKGKKRKMMRLPRREREALKEYEVLRLFFDVEHPLSSFSLHTRKITPNANPINPPKVKMK